MKRKLLGFLASWCKKNKNEEVQNAKTIGIYVKEKKII
jgi:hypothetical protein